MEKRGLRNLIAMGYILGWLFCPTRGPVNDLKDLLICAYESADNFLEYIRPHHF